MLDSSVVLEVKEIDEECVVESRAGSSSVGDRQEVGQGRGWDEVGGGSCIPEDRKAQGWQTWMDRERRNGYGPKEEVVGTDWPRLGEVQIHTEKVPSGPRRGLILLYIRICRLK